ncbi:O-acetyl-ADP-ribose deacetylase [Propionibacterium australiense]|uniref:Macro_Appr_pase_like n=2 Tax=Propionibacterium TaxID=1743 RepID=A0A383S9W8_9ACTN|nr:O-acetyl-ADP-ribose deacetylase [Propionibacterium australiense]RLP06206.1 O-acetyl-ADP-ribose deacetylase [Propionibacterium australiense]RLP06361.1 O-acetyl-ADP-ribose deacetylase [Propionibacterium australiense]SYZ34593.1 Macro_Appr_pase_like [Propionibacterium australiense]VEH92138.1 O-acetyl-ADP-ribose deacetylase [Propionibacterium australiense]
MDIRIVRADITTVAADAIVNAANPSLLGGGGVDGAIHRAGGPAVLEACRELRATSLPEGLPRGQAVATTAGRLPARWVIHTAGPVFSRTQDRSQVLADCYRNCLAVADGLGADSIAFPTISAGVYGWPVADATRIAVDTLTATPTRVRTALLVAFGDEAYEGYARALAAVQG